MVSVTLIFRSAGITRASEGKKRTDAAYTCIREMDGILYTKREEEKKQKSQGTTCIKERESAGHDRIREEETGSSRPLSRTRPRAIKEGVMR